MRVVCLKHTVEVEQSKRGYMQLILEDKEIYKDRHQISEKPFKPVCV